MHFRGVRIARYVSSDGALQDVLTLNLDGDQQVAQHGAALLPGGDIVIAGSYRGGIDFRDGCPALPDAGESENFFIARVSNKGVVWSRGFGDATESQIAAAGRMTPRGSSPRRMSTRPTTPRACDSTTGSACSSSGWIRTGS
ncbi:hypothetical protein ACMHYB_00860 [Sorangium sp. So ce1128]